MILQSLNRYYDILVEDQNTKIATYGYSTIGVSYALHISTDGELLDILPLYAVEQRGKKTIEVPRPMMVPALVKRSVNIAPNFLWDNAVYVLGISERGLKDPQYSFKRFEAFRQFNIDLVTNVKNDTSRAIQSFLRWYEPSTGRENPIITPHLDALLKGGNIVFFCQGAFVHDDPEIRSVWESHLAEDGSDRMQCLVTGIEAPIVRLHPSIKRVRNAQPTGATLVGFNAAAYESYNRSQGNNSPVSEKAAFAYTTVLNYMLSDANPNKKFFLGDTTVIYWAESKNRKYELALASILDPDYVEDQDNADQESRKDAEKILQDLTKKVRRVQMLDLDSLLQSLESENPRFYILGLAPNAARVSVRFFITDPFLVIVRNIISHYEDLKIIKEFDYQPDYITINQVLNETVSKKSREKDASPLLAGAVFRAILLNTPYPVALYYAIINRIRADIDDRSKGINKINYERAAIMKAFLIRKYRHQSKNPFEEVLVMSLNEQSTIPAYLLGRLFAVLEKVQQEAIGDVNASIKDRYFTSACASPRSVFPILLRLSQHHIAKSESGGFRERQIEMIMNQLDLEKNPFPARFTLDEQGIFILGYYHQRKDLWTAKTKNKQIESAITSQ